MRRFLIKKLLRHNDFYFILECFYGRLLLPQEVKAMYKSFIEYEERNVDK